MSTRWNVIMAALGAGAFGVLMALRSEVSGAGPRAAIAALAFACIGVILAVVVGKARRSHR